MVIGHPDTDQKNNLGLAVLDYRQYGGEERLEKIFQEGRPLVCHFARIYGVGRSNEDLIQVGYEGLLKAVRRFDPERRVQFVTFAAHYIMGEMRHYRRREAAYERPSWLVEFQERIFQAMDEHLQLTGELPKLQDIARTVNVEENGITQILRVGRVSLDELDISQVRSQYYESFHLPIEDKIFLWQAIESLSELQKSVVCLLFFKDLTQTQVAAELGIGQRRVSRILQRALKQMREWLSN